MGVPFVWTAERYPEICPVPGASSVAESELRDSPSADM